MPTYYIDPTYPVNGTGTSSDPFNVWPSRSSNNVYLQKRGTTASVALTAFGVSNITFGAYGTGSNPVVNGGASRGLNCSNASGITIDGIDFVSTGTYGASWDGGSNFTAIDSTITGTRCGLNVISSASAVSNVSLTRVTAKHTALANEQSGLFIGAQSNNNITNVSLTDCTFSNNAYIGVQIKASTDNSSAAINGVRVIGCNISDNGANGLLINTGMTALSSAKVVTNAVIDGNTINNNGGPGTALTIRDGYNVVRYNTVNGNNWAGQTGTGGLQLAGASNTDCYGNVCRDNRTLFQFDGVGLYLDVASGTLVDVGCENCRVFNNLCVGNTDYAPNPANIDSSMLSAGIGILFSQNNTITGNVCIGNAAGVCVGAWTINNRIYNNTLVGNKYGVVQLWNMTSPGNTIRNNIVKDCTSHTFLAPDIGTRTTTGNITLSATTGTITCTSTANDFAVHAFGYAILAGSGYAHIISKQSNTQVTAKVLVPFSGTTFTNGNWSLSFGQNQGVWPGYSALFGNAAGAYAGTEQSLTEGSNNVTADPRVFSDGSIASNSPCATAGTYVSGITLRNGRLYPGYVPIGAFKAVLPRKLKT